MWMLGLNRWTPFSTPSELQSADPPGSRRLDRGSQGLKIRRPIVEGIYHIILRIYYMSKVVSKLSLATQRRLSVESQKQASEL